MERDFVDSPRAGAPGAPAFSTWTQLVRLPRPPDILLWAFHYPQENNQRAFLKYLTII